MLNLNFEQMEELTEMGYEGCFIEDIEDGDRIAIGNWSSSLDPLKPPISFVTVSGFRKIPRYPRNENGYVVGAPDEWLILFIGEHPNKMKEPISCGSGHGIFRFNPDNIRGYNQDMISDEAWSAFSASCISRY